MYLYELSTTHKTQTISLNVSFIPAPKRVSGLNYRLADPFVCEQQLTPGNVSKDLLSIINRTLKGCHKVDVQGLLGLIVFDLYSKDLVVCDIVLRFQCSYKARF